MPVVVDQRKDSGLDRVARIGKFAAEAFLHTERHKNKKQHFRAITFATRKMRKKTKMKMKAGAESEPEKEEEKLNEEVFILFSAFTLFSTLPLLLP